MSVQKTQPHRLRAPFFLSLTIHGAALVLIVWATRLSDAVKSSSVPSTVMLVQVGPLEAFRHSAPSESARSQSTQSQSIRVKTPRDEDTNEESHEASHEASHALASGVTASALEASGILANYLGQVVSVIDARKTYPKAALFEEQEGEVVLVLDIEADGRLSDVSVIRSSGVAALDKGARESVTALGRLPALPVGVAAPLHLHVPIRYTLDRRRTR